MSADNLLERLRDLYTQATTEKSHYYTAVCVGDSIKTIERQARQISAYRELVFEATWDGYDDKEITQRIAEIEAIK